MGRTSPIPRRSRSIRTPPRAYVAIANEDQVVVIDTAHMSRREGAVGAATAGRRRVSGRAGGHSGRPAAGRGRGRRRRAGGLRAALRAPWSGGSRPPRIRPTCRSAKRLLMWIAAKGFGSGANPQRPQPASAPATTTCSCIPGRRCSARAGRGAAVPDRSPILATDRGRQPPDHADQLTAARPPGRRCGRAARSSTSSTSCARTGPTTRSSATIRAATATPS